MPYASICPHCNKPGIPYSHKLVNATSTLTAARCVLCGSYAIIEPRTLAWLGFPDIFVWPGALLMWVVSQDARFALQCGLALYILVHALAVRQARLVAFCPDDGPWIESRRRWWIISVIALNVLLLALTMLVPKTLL